MTQYTPGPWTAAEIRHDYDQVVRGPDHGPIAIVCLGGYTKPTGRANARLMAAAPQLLEALEAVNAGYKENTLDYVDDHDLYVPLALKLVRAAIKAATE